MTLNITVLTEGAVFQCADFRLTDLDSGDVISDASDKIVPLAVDSWSGFATYTGIGRVGTEVRCENSVKLARRNRRGVYGANCCHRRGEGHAMAGASSSGPSAS